MSQSDSDITIRAVWQPMTGALSETRQGTAEISPCGQYRYLLTRRWKDGPALNFVMLNPSVADASQDDPTIRRCTVRAKALGYSALTVTNLFALRSTSPLALPKHADPVGPENDRYLLAAAEAAGLVVCAWGLDGKLRGRGKAVERLLRGRGYPLHALKLSKDGLPCHPLYLPYSLRPVPYGGV